MRAELLELICILFNLQILALGSVQLPQSLHPERCALPFKIVHVLIDHGSSRQELVDIQLILVLSKAFPELRLVSVRHQL